MAYSNEKQKLSDFVKENISLPRFQRKSTWTERQNFGLAISVFQDYPIGVVIINKENVFEPHTGNKVLKKWLLDGRQRRTALQEMYLNPIALYRWAKKCLRLSDKDQPEDVSRKFWAEVRQYLNSEDDQENEEENAEPVFIEEGTPLDDQSFSPQKMVGHLQILERIIKMVHPLKKNDSSKWQETFDFMRFCVKLPYESKSKRGQIDAKALRLWIQNYLGRQEELNETAFYDELEIFAAPGQERAFRQSIHDNWSYIKESIDALNQFDLVFNEAEVGQIVLSNATPLDAQNIFSRINSGGTVLKAEELLSAKPYWNKKVEVDSSIASTVSDMYELLGVKQAQCGVVRWDVAATLITRLSDLGLLFEHSLLKGKNPNMEEVTLCFKLLSSIYMKGMSKLHVSELTSDNNFQKAWEDSLNTLVEELNTVFKLISDSSSVFKFFADWRKPLQSLIPAAALLEFIATLYFYWKELGKPHSGQGELEKFNQAARILFDRVIFESMTGFWKGSGDSKMAKNLAEYSQLVKNAVAAKEWDNLIHGLCEEGKYQSVRCSKENVRPLLYYGVALQERRPSVASSARFSFEVDHLIAKSDLINSGSEEAQFFSECLANFSLMPKEINNSKRAKSLKEITDRYVISEIESCSGISKNDFEKYSDKNNLNKLRYEREKYFLKIFGSGRDNLRQKFLNN